MIEKTGKQYRLEQANKFLEVVASCKRRFFEYIHPEGRVVSRFRIRDDGKIFFLNEWKLEWIYVSRYCAYKGFHHGGTLHSLVSGIVSWIKSGKPYFQEDFFSAKHWAQPQSDMDSIVSCGKAIGLIKRDARLFIPELNVPFLFWSCCDCDQSRVSWSKIDGENIARCETCGKTNIPRTQNGQAETA